MQSRKKPFVLTDTWLGWSYTNGYFVKGLIDMAKIASYLSPTQLAASTFSLTAPTLAQYIGNETTIATTHFISIGLNLLANPVYFAATYGANHIGDHVLTTQWDLLTEDQQSDSKWKEFFAALYIAKAECAKKVGAKAYEMTQQPQTPDTNTQAKDEQDVKADADRKQQKAEQAQQKAKDLEAKQEQSNREISKLVETETQKKINGKSIRPYELDKHKVERTPKQAEQVLKEGGTIKFFGEKKHGHHEASYSHQVQVAGRTQLNQEVNAAQVAAQNAQQEAAAARQRIQETQTTEAVQRAAQEALNQARRLEESLRVNSQNRAQERARQDRYAREEQGLDQGLAQLQAEGQARQEREIDQHQEIALKEQAQNEEESRQESTDSSIAHSLLLQPAQHTVQLDRNKENNQQILLRQPPDYIDYKEKPSEREKKKVERSSNQSLLSQGFFAPSNTATTNSKAFGTRQQTLGDSLNIAWRIKELGGDKKAQLAAQNINRPKI
ncbi:MAG: hypothetical protein KIT56_04685 [Gammaproteobacteria bacterium]|nr:hypothetical protein [Gammaproteobacteria bacterium]MCW5583174.1 hypothetical protein [Gammaproteobacteria bacterium]